MDSDLTRFSDLRRPERAPFRTTRFNVRYRDLIGGWPNLVGKRLCGFCHGIRCAAHLATDPVGVCAFPNQRIEFTYVAASPIRYQAIEVEGPRRLLLVLRRQLAYEDIAVPGRLHIAPMWIYCEVRARDVRSILAEALCDVHYWAVFLKYIRCEARHHRF